MRLFRYLFVSLLPLTILSACASEQSASVNTAAKVYETRLKNGMRILVKEDHRSPVVITQIWYKVGSSYEHNGITGISHVLEHMMFKGTKKLKPNEFSKIIAANGGRENAFTSRDYTAYYQYLEKSRLKVSFKLEADRMQGLTLSKTEFEKERNVVIEERKLRTEDKPTSLTYERFNSVAYQNSPYRIPIVGWMNDLKHMTIGDLRRWYKRWYAPNNAILVVVGDVNPEEVTKLAETHFGSLKRQLIRLPKPQTEVMQSGLKRIVVKRPAKLAYLIMGYHVPSVKTAKEKWEPYALEVLAWVLDGGRSARLNASLIHEQAIAASANASYDPFARLSSMLMLDGVPAQGKTVVDLEKALRQEIEKLKTELASDAELARVKAQVVAENVFQRDSIFYQALLIGQMETKGYSWKTVDEYVERINKVTAAQIQAVAKKYLHDDRLTIARLDPQPLTSTPKRRSSTSGGRHGR